MNCDSSLGALRTELILKYPKVPELAIIRSDSKRLELIEKIELIISQINESIANIQPPVLGTIVHCTSKNCFFDGRIRMKEIKTKTRNIDFGKMNCRSNFAIIIFLLSKIHKLLTTRQTSTRRELYYKNLQIFHSQNQVDDGMKDACYILNAPSWELRVLATSKGIVSGPLVLKLANGEVLDCSKKGGVSIPSDVLEIENMSSLAKWVLIIEKDSSFQKVIENDASSTLGPYIAITGKGYPDISTRMLVCKFWEFLRIPILALVDADPYGFEIMSVYRFGSMSMSSYSENLACPAVRWLGVHPSDIKPLLLDAKNLSLKDIKKINNLLQRCYVEENEKLAFQLQVLLEVNLKAEIEELSNISTNYLTDVYVRNKIQCKEFF